MSETARSLTAMERHLARLQIPQDFLGLRPDVQAHAASEFRMKAKIWRGFAADARSESDREHCLAVADAWDRRAAFIEKHLVAGEPVEDMWGTF